MIDETDWHYIVLEHNLDSKDYKELKAKIKSYYNEGEYTIEVSSALILTRRYNLEIITELPEMMETYFLGLYTENNIENINYLLEGKCKTRITRDIQSPLQDKAWKSKMIINSDREMLDVLQDRINNSYYTSFQTNKINYELEKQKELAQKIIYNWESINDYSR